MVKTNRQLTLPEAVRLAFPTLFEPKQIKIGGQPKGDPKFSVGIVIPQALVKTVQLLTTTQQEMITQAWPDGNYPSNFHWAMQWGPTARPKDPNLADCYILNAYANEDSRPQVVTRDRVNGGYVPITDPSVIYSGCEAYVNIALFCYQTTAVNGGIGVGINLVLPTGRDVGRFDGRATAAGAFDELGEVETVDPAGGPMPGHGMGTPHQPDAGKIAANAPPPPGPSGAPPWQQQQPPVTQPPAQGPGPGIHGNMNQPILQDPASGRQYFIDPQSGQAVWL